MSGHSKHKSIATEPAQRSSAGEVLSITPLREPHRSRLSLHLSDPVDGASRHVDRISFQARLSGPQAAQQRPTVEVFLKLHGVEHEEYRLSPGEPEHGRRIGDKPFLAEIATNPRGDQLYIEGTIDVGALVPAEGEDTVVCSIYLSIEQPERRIISNSTTFALEAHNRRQQAFGGLDPCGAAEINSDYLVVRGWAVCAGQPLRRASVKVAGRAIGDAVCGFNRAAEQQALPDLIAAEGSCFEHVLSRTDLLAAGIGDQELANGVCIEAECRFAAGRKLRLLSANVRWLPPPWNDPATSPPIGRCEAVRYNERGEAEFEGWVVSPGGGRPLLTVRWQRTHLQLESEGPHYVPVDWAADEVLSQRYPTAGAGGANRFRFSLNPKIFGRRPGKLELLATDRINRQTAVFRPLLLLDAPHVPHQSRSPLREALSYLLERVSALSALLPARQIAQDDKLVLGRLGLGTREINRPPRVVFCAHNLSSVEGAPKVLFEVISHLRPEIEPLVVASRGGQLEAMLERINVRTAVLANLDLVGQTPERYEAGQRELLEIFARRQPDLVYANVIDSFWAIDAAARVGTSCVWAIHESRPPAEFFCHLDRRLKLRFLDCLDRASKKIFVADATKRLFDNFGRSRASVCIPNGIDLEEVEAVKAATSRKEARAQVGIAEDQFVVSIIGTTTPRKGQDLFIAEMARLAALLPDQELKFLVVGARQIEFLDELRRQAQELDLGCRIRFIEEQPEVGKYYLASDVIVIASREESAPLVSLEAFAYGTPLVSTAVFGLAEQVAHEYNALVVDAEKPGEISASVARLFSDRALREKLVKAGLQTVSEKFRLEKTLARYREEIMGVLDDGSGSMRFCG